MDGNVTRALSDQYFYCTLGRSLPDESISLSGFKHSFPSWGPRRRHAIQPVAFLVKVGSELFSTLHRHFTIHVLLPQRRPAQRISQLGGGLPSFENLF